MLIIGCDYHPKWQQVAWFDPETGEVGEQKLENGSGEAERWYRQLPVPSLIGLESTGNSQWFIDLLQRLGHAVWIGDAAVIRASYVRKQKNDKRDGAHVLKLLREGRFPRLWVPSREQRDGRQLLIHRHKLVQIRSRVAQQAAEQDPQARLLLTQPGVGPITALAFVLTIGEVARFARGKQVASYLGLIPREHSSGGRQRLGAISKQGNGFLRMLLVEAAHSVVRLDEGFRKQYQHRCHSKAKGVAKVAAARKLAIRLYWMLRTQTPYPEIVRIESSPRVPLVGAS